MASSTTHGLLLGLLLFGSAFVGANHKKEDDLLDKPVLRFIPANAIINDHITDGGGNPKADPNKIPAVLPPPPPHTPPTFVQPSPIARVAPAPAPVKPAPVKPAPMKIQPVEEDKEEPIDLKGLEPVANPHKIKVNTQFTKRTNDEVVKKRKAEQEAAEQEEREAREAQAKYERQVQAYNHYHHEVVSKLHNAVSGISSEKGSPNVVEVFGPGGQAYVSYGDYVKKVYESAWNPPDEANEESSLVKVRVTIARDGAVLSAQIVTPSNNPLMDRSVQRTLNTVRDIGQSFPPGTKDPKRTFIFRFDVRAKKGLG